MSIVCVEQSLFDGISRPITQPDSKQQTSPVSVRLVRVAVDDERTVSSRLDLAGRVAFTLDEVQVRNEDWSMWDFRSNDRQAHRGRPR